jgi:outer membrane protein assembly factor BamB
MQYAGCPQTAESFAIRRFRVFLHALRFLNTTATPMKQIHSFPNPNALFRASAGGRNVRAVIALLAFAGAALAGETEWPQFRGPMGQGISSAVNVPIEWNADSHIAWKVELPGHGWSSPVLSRGRLYLTAAVPDAGSTDLTLHTLCLDSKDGKILWDTEVFRPDPSLTAAMHRKNSPASATPIVTEDRLYIHFGHMGTAALDLSGKILWTQNQLAYAPVHGNGGSPILLGDELIFSCDGQDDPFVAALDAKTGVIRWKTPRNSNAKKKFSFSTPLAISVGGATEVISPGPGFVGAYDPSDGRELWRVNYG